MQAVSGSERRRYQRTPIHIDVVLSCDETSAQRHVVAVHDLSLSGMAIYPGNLNLKVGDAVCICLSDKSDQCSRDHVIEATVVHHYEKYVGIRFDSVGIYVLKDLQRVLKQELGKRELIC